MDETVTPLRRRGRPPSGGSDASGEVQSLDRAMGLLELLASADGMHLSELARLAELPTSTVHRLLGTLHRRALVSHDAESGLWTVGVGLFRIGSAYLRIRKLPELGRPVIRELLKKTDETVHLSMIDGHEVVCVAQAEAHTAIRAFFRLGRRVPLHASAAGKAVLMAARPEWRDERLTGDRLERLTKNTLVARDALEKDLAKSAKRGWSLDDEENTVGMRCVAAPIRDEWGEPVGALSISGPTVRMGRERLPDLGDEVARAASHLTVLFSGRGTPST